MTRSRALGTTRALALTLLALLGSPLAAGATPQDSDETEPAETESDGTGSAEAPASTDPAAEPAGDDVEAVHDALRALRDRALAAINSADIDALLELVDDDVVFTAMNAEVCRGKEEVRAYFERMMEGPDRIVDSLAAELTVDTLSILHGDDTAIAYGSSRERYRLTSGLEVEVVPRWSATVVREDGRWLIASFQSSADLFDNPLLRQARRSRIWVAAVAAIAGLLVGVLLGRRRGRQA